MAEEGKKVSFGFAKSIKKPVLKNIVPQEEKKVDYIECLDEKNIKVIGEEEKKDEPLVIPLLGSKTWHDRIINHIDADIFEPKENKEKTEDVNINKEVKSKLSNGNASPQIITKELEQLVDNKVVTLEEQAAKEIIEELKLKEQQETKTNDFTLPLVEDQSLRGQEQSTLEDYERIPVDVYGFAMLRGMGWQPGKGIGRNEKVVSAVIPELRPKGMGLGADKVTQQKNTDSNKQEEELKIEKGTFVKIIAGKQSNNYGQIEGFDDDAGRLIIKLALGGSIISVNEFMVQPVTKSEYSKNSKVLTFRLSLVQLEVHEVKTKNIEKAVSYISSAKKQNADIVAFPECFNSPYGIQYFPKYAEHIPDGETSVALSKAAKENNIYVVGGTIPERDGDKLFNTCTIWGPDGTLIAKHRKMHLFDINIPDKIIFRESDSLSSGNSLTMFEVKNCKIGIGICYDIRFEEMARIYRNKGCQMLIYPAAFNLTTGPLHWSLLQRSRANDNQLYIAGISPARNPSASYVAWGHTQLTSPWGEILHDLETHESMVVTDIDLKIVEEVRAQIPIFYQRRTDLYDTIWKKD
ncbi:deaminated glutathione amidase-like [Apis dorsata]|uniref:deaminated glutathione amidase-like n=1 Tax=Apis dorsata TaxID=7462 RepID=UPI0003DF5730|nr:deaminated glutathione amidase-like [Apis dorsata]